MTIWQILKREVALAWATFFDSEWRRSKEWQRARKLCIARYNGRCAVTGRKLMVKHVHHILDASTHPYLRYTQDNLILVSQTVHVAYHIDYMGGYHVPTTYKSWRAFVKWYRRVHGFDH